MYQSYFDKVKEAARGMVRLNESQSAQILKDLSQELINRSAEIIESNKTDLNRMSPDDPKYDRLKLTPERIKGIAEDLVSVSELPSPIGEIIEERTLTSGLHLQKKRVPLGVVGVIFEARPNVTIDVFALCLRSGNACVLKGGSDAESSNKVLAEIIKSILTKHGQNAEIVQLLPAERAATEALMQAVGEVDVLIPRGSQALINAVRNNAKIPVIETGAGIVHTFFDKDADLQIGKQIIFNAKTRRVSVCNALDCLILHKNRLDDLVELTVDLIAKNVKILADTEAFEKLKGKYPDELLQKASRNDFGTEFLSHKMSIKTVENTNEALDHIFKYSSKHSEAIISNNEETIEKYLNEVDAAAVYVNASTAFTDGAQFGLGAEIGISTQKLHARGPMGLKELTSYKWIVKGNGQIRPA